MQAYRHIQRHTDRGLQTHLRTNTFKQAHTQTHIIQLHINSQGKKRPSTIGQLLTLQCLRLSQKILRVCYQLPQSSKLN